MAEDPESTNGPDQTDDEYPVLSPDPQRVDRKPSFQPVDLDELLGSAESDETRFQFSLAELMLLALVVALFLGVVSYLPGGYAAKNLAGMAGMVLVIFRITLELLRPGRKVLYVAWWVMLTFYLAICVLAVIMAS